MRNSTIYTNKPKTFRRSSKKILSYWGGNLQNIEKGMREIYESDGWTMELVEKLLYWLATRDLSIFTDEELERVRVLSQTDQSGAEALIVAYDCDAMDYRQLFINSVKPHVYVALKLFSDIWPTKAREHSFSITQEIVDELCNTKIALLNSHPYWRDLDKLIKDSDNWALTERYYYLAKQTVHCVDAKTEVLTELGWIKVHDIIKDENKSLPIMVYNGKFSYFESPSTWHSGEYEGDMIHFNGDEVDQYVTPEHKIVYISNGNTKTMPACNAAKLKQLKIPCSTFYCGSVALPPWKIKLLVAIQADANWHLKEGVRFRLAKSRKVNRLLDILLEGGIEYEHKCDEFIDNGLPISTFTIRNIGDILGYFNGVKLWDSWLLKFSVDNLCTFIDELKYWDGTQTNTFRHKRQEYISKHEQNALWVKTICHLVNRQGTLSFDGGVYTVGINQRSNSIASTVTNSYFSGMVYCPTVSTGMFLVRRNGKISITGNSANYGIQKNTFRMNILEKSGGKIVVPDNEAARFLNTYRALFPEIPDRCRRVEEQVKKTGMLYNMFGFPYTITDYDVGSTTMKDCFAWGPQSTVGEITRIAVSDFQEYAEHNKLPWDVIQDNHDSFLTQGPLYDTKERCKKMQEFMNVPLVSPVDGVKFNMKSECQVGFNWGPMKTGKNDLGLREIKW